jgi:hypothetical protein
MAKALMRTHGSWTSIAVPTWMPSQVKTIHLVDPELFVDPTRHLMPLPVRIVLGFARVSGFLRMRPLKDAGSVARS